jgi:protein-arginine kinase
MDCVERKSKYELLKIIDNIEQSLKKNEYEKAFFMFLLYLKNMNALDKDILITHFNNYFSEISTC